MRSIQLQKVYDVVAKVEAAEQEKCKRGETSNKHYRAVVICLDDGSTMSLQNSYVETYENEDG